MQGLTHKREHGKNWIIYGRISDSGTTFLPVKEVCFDRFQDAEWADVVGSELASPMTESDHEFIETVLNSQMPPSWELVNEAKDRCDLELALSILNRLYHAAYGCPTTIKLRKGMYL